jgi:TPR repeat protein
MMWLHENRIIHRDLKPANVLLDADLNPRVADFGLSKFTAEGQTMNQTLNGGTPTFMAPEIHQGEGYDFKVDVYAFGISMFIILTALAPFPKIREAYALMSRVVNGLRPRIPDTVPEGYAQLMADCWDASPDRRPTFHNVVQRLGDPKLLEDAGVDLSQFQAYQRLIAPKELIPLVHGVKSKLDDSSLIMVKELSPEHLKALADSGDHESQLQYADMLFESGEFGSAAKYYSLAADQGNTDAALHLAELFEKGTGVTQDLAKSAALLSRASSTGDPRAKTAYARLLLHGMGTHRDFAQAARLYREAAEAHDPEAQVALGELLEEGRGVAKNLDEALKWYKAASDGASARGMFQWADMKHHGRHTDINVPEAARLYSLAAARGVPEAVYALCEILKTGEGGVPRDLAKAAEVAMESAERGHFLGLVQWAECLERGIGIAVDAERAREVLARAQGPEFVKEQNDYAFALENGKGCRQDQAAALRWYRVAAGHREPMAMYNLGMSLLRQSPAEAAELFRQAAEAGNELAMYRYAACLRGGQGVAKNAVEAKNWFAKAAAAGNPGACRMLGLMFENGEGGRSDKVEAVRWYQMAADKGDTVGMACLGDMYENGKGVPKNLAEAIRWYRQAIELNAPVMALRNLALLYRDGKGVEKNLDEARALLERAIALGFPEAAKLLTTLK